MLRNTFYSSALRLRLPPGESWLIPFRNVSGRPARFAACTPSLAPRPRGGRVTGMMMHCDVSSAVAYRSAQCVAEAEPKAIYQEFSGSPAARIPIHRRDREPRRPSTQTRGATRAISIASNGAGALGGASATSTGWPVTKIFTRQTAYSGK